MPSEDETIGTHEFFLNRALLLAERSRDCATSPPAPDERGWGVPDWRDVEACPTADELDDLEWRWEFLRRRHGFRLDWLRPPTEFDPVPKEFYFAEVYDIDRPVDPRVSIRDLAQDMSMSMRRGTEAAIRYPFSGLAPFRGSLLSQTIVDYRFLDRIIPENPGPDDIFARFDLGRPIKPQIAQAEYYLQRLREEAYPEAGNNTRKRTSLWPTYLRLLDAADADASLREMIAALPEHVAPTEQQARTALAAAEQLRREWRHTAIPAK
jgi:hypothetical protein